MFGHSATFGSFSTDPRHLSDITTDDTFCPWKLQQAPSLDDDTNNNNVVNSTIGDVDRLLLVHVNKATAGIGASWSGNLLAGGGLEDVAQLVRAAPAGYQLHSPIQLSMTQLQVSHPNFLANAHGVALKW